MKAGKQTEAIQPKRVLVTPAGSHPPDDHTPEHRGAAFDAKLFTDINMFDPPLERMAAQGNCVTGNVSGAAKMALMRAGG